MKITKLGHSCVLVDVGGEIALFDPGVWSERERIDAIEHVDTIIYTHEHEDHFDIEILESLLSRFPDVHVISNQQIKSIIEEAGVRAILKEESSSAVKFTSPHESLPIPNAQAPKENGYHFKDVFTHPGDSQSFSETKNVLAMPFIGPWGKTGDSVAKVLELKPEYVLAIHDWHYTDEAKRWLQELVDRVFEPAGIKLLPNKNGQVIELDV